ncbi:cadherin-related family member 5 [Dipodomys spectabilis]|uniref:cadherin-related family member 5 n=1 Tax=Dipodomys spectabilis TaxID=105255 RepID=UPI001C53EEEE|nr:cadherin-related family member 5 [Dipodomys spectabilis]
MGALALLGPPLLLPLLLALLGRAPGVAAQTQVCTVNQSYFQLEENTNITGPLANITVPLGQHVELSDLSTPLAFEIRGNQLFLNTTLDYEETPILEAHIICKRGSSVVTNFRVLVVVQDVNDNAPEFPFITKQWNVTEDTKVKSVVIPEAELQATDKDKDDTLFYSLLEVTPGASSFFSLEGVNRPSLRLDKPLDFLKTPNMTFQLIVQDTVGSTEPSHTATATLVLYVLPADLRPPWFLPCTYSDGYVCLEAQYHGSVPVGHRPTSPLTLRPGPIYAVDGDRGIDQRIIYSIAGGNQEDTFAIDDTSGNLTMAKSVPSPTVFVLMVKAEQADGARYSITKATLEARGTAGRSPRFPQSVFRGTVEAGLGANATVRDSASPTQFLRIWAEDPEFPDLNSAIRYRITNSSDFTMEGEIVLTTRALQHASVFYAEVEANNTVTVATATATAEIRVTEQEPPAAPPHRWASVQLPRSPASCPAGGPLTSSGPHPPLGTTLRPPVSSTPGLPPTEGAGSSPPPATPGGGSQPTAPPSATPGGGSAQTPTPESAQPTAPTEGAGSSPPSATPGGGSAQTLKPGSTQTTMSPGPSRSPPAAGRGGPGGDSQPGAGQPDTGQHFSTVDMAVLGGVLGALLLLALIGLVILLHKQYGHRLHCCSGKAGEPQALGSDNQAFLKEEEAAWAPSPSPEPQPTPPEKTPASPDPETPELPTPRQPSPEPLGLAPGAPTPAGAADSPSAAVRSILTKERRPEGGYKAVWFGEDIGAEADVVVLNTPAAEADGPGNAGSEDEGSDEDAGRRTPPAGSPDSTYI